MAAMSFITRLPNRISSMATQQKQVISTDEYFRHLVKERENYHSLLH